MTLFALGYILGCCFHLYFAQTCNIPDDIVAARAPGDIIIGGLFSAHQEIIGLSKRTQPGRFQCNGFDLRGFMRSLAMIYTVEEINNSNYLPGIKLGYEVYDTCSDAGKAMEGAVRFVSKYNSTEQGEAMSCNYTDYLPVVHAVVGSGYSEESIAASRLLSYYLIPQISYASSSSLLSDKDRYLSFLRTVPSDTFQTKALAELIRKFEWEWIRTVASNDDYGRSAMAEFESAISNSTTACIEGHDYISAYLNSSAVDNDIKSTVKRIINSTAHVIVVFAKGQLVKRLFEEFLKYNVTKIWIASEIWSTSSLVLNMINIDKTGTILGFSFKNGKIPGFKEYLEALQMKDYFINKLIDEYKYLRFSCTQDYLSYLNCSMTSSKTCQLPNQDVPKSEFACTKLNKSIVNDSFLVDNLELGGTYGAYLSVKAIAQALRNLLQCINGTCEKSINVPPWQLLAEIKNINISQDNDEPFHFLTNGDSVNGYDLINWQKKGNAMQLKTVGKYVLNGTVTFDPNAIIWKTNKSSKCSRQCVPGEAKKTGSTSVCCYECVSCTEGYYSDKYDMTDCIPCSKDQWSGNASTKCEKRTVVFLRWTDGFSIVLIAFSVLGIILLFAMAIIFAKHLNTPAVKAAGGTFSYVLLLSLTLSIISTFFFIGEPEDYKCVIRQPLYGISFSTCVSCILVKSFRIVVAFKCNPLQTKLKHAYRPFVITIAFTCLQAILCTMWLIFKQPEFQKNYDTPKQILYYCNEGSYVALGMMLGYIALLAFICFIFAFMGRKMPDRYNEAKYITFSMLIYLFVWISFVPIYVTTVGNKYLPAVEVVAILASSYGIICCHLLPTCYIIYCKKNINTMTKYLQSIHNFYHAKEIASRVKNFPLPHINSSGYSVSKDKSSTWHDSPHCECILRRRHKSW